MGWTKVMLFLLVLLLVLNGVMAVIVFTYRRDTTSIPQSALDDMKELLSADGIYLDKDAVENGLISLRIAAGAFPPETHTLIATAISGTEVERSYPVPDGEILVMRNGDRYTFGRAFAFSLVKAGAPPSVSADTSGFVSAGRKAVREQEKLLRAALEIRSFGTSSGTSFEWNTETAIRNEETGVWLLKVRQTYRGVPVCGCELTAEGNESGITRLNGGWCFSFPDSEQESQLLDQLNALYLVRGLLQENPNALARTIVSVSSCYYPYVTPVNGRFTLVPAWRVMTNSGDEYVLNAVDGSRSK